MYSARRCLPEQSSQQYTVTITKPLDSNVLESFDGEYSPPVKIQRMEHL